MSDIKLFRIGAGTVDELPGITYTIEKFFSDAVRFLASEFTTTNGGRTDTLGLDENSWPAILEYKRMSILPP